MEQFIGEFAVKKVTVLPELVSFFGTPVVEVEFPSRPSEIMTKKVFDLVATTEPSNSTAVRDKQIDAFKVELAPVISRFVLNMYSPDKTKEVAEVVEKAVMLAAEYSFKLRDIDSAFNVVSGDIISVFKAIGENVDMNYDRVTQYFWTGKDGDFIPGTSPVSEVNLLQTKKFLEKIAKENESAKALNN